jgi:hypothetical protein
MGHDKAVKNETPKLGVLGIDFNQVEKALKSKPTNIEKIKYLEWQIEYNGVEKGVDYYSNHSSHSEPIPDFWNGIMYARAGMEDENSENQAYLAGVQAWKDYCQILEIKSNLEQGRPYSIRLNQTQKDEQKPAVKHYVLTYLLECWAKDESYPIGEKKELERIGHQRMKGKSGNTFYKAFGRLCEKDIHNIKVLSEIGGDNWREIVLSLTNDREKVGAYLRSKGL